VAVYEGLWDCTSCGTTGVGGSVHVCPACGAPRADDVKFYLPGEGQRKVVTDAAQVREAKAGEDWYCEHCGAGTSAAQDTCRQCGAPRGSSKVHSQAKADEARRHGPVTPAAAPPAKMSRGACAVMAIVALLSCCCLGFLGMPSHVEVTIAGRSWERSQEIEAYRTVTESGWEVPAGGRIKGQERKVHHQEQVYDHTEHRTRSVQVQTGTRQVKDGVRDLGNGHFEDTYRDEPIYERRQESYDEPVYRQEPRYQPWYTWDIDRWVPDRTVRLAGTDDEPRWPDVPAATERERPGARHEAYRLELRTKEGKSFTWVCPDEARWRSFTKGQAVVATISGDEVKDVQPPEAKR
jgi:hypothetical protein